jgi:hypothetical protein
MIGLKDRAIVLLRSRPGTRLLLALFAVLVAGVIFVGLKDPPGYILGYLATAVIFFLMVRGWRSARNFVILVLATVVSCILISGLYVEVVTRIAEWAWGPGVADRTPMRIIEAIITYLLLFGVPVGLAFGIGGAIIVGIRRLLRSRVHEPVTHDT